MPLLFIHWVGDFVLQSDWMAKNKSKNILALSSHVFVYTTYLFITSLLLFNDYKAWVIFTLINGGLHFIIDFVTSIITSYYWSKGDTHNFFVMVGFDQYIHTSCLLISFYWLYA